MFLGTAGLAALSIAGPAAAAGPTIIEMVKNSNGSYSLPADAASKVSAPRLAMMEQASNRALKIAQSSNLSLPKANGLLTRMVRPFAKARGVGGIFREVLTVGLIAGLTWALANGDVIQQTSDGQAERTQKECRVTGNYPPRPSQITQISTGMYRDSSGNVIAYSYQSVPGWSGGTVPAPSGWTWVYQTNALGVTQVWFSRNVTTDNCKDFKFPRIPMPQLPDLAGPENQLPDPQKERIPDIVLGQAPQVTVPADGTVPGIEQPPEIASPAPGEKVPLPGPVTIGDVSSPWDAPWGEEPWFKFPADTQTGTGTGTDPTDPTEPTDPTAPYPTGEAVEPEEGGELPTFDKFSGPFKNLFDPFGAAFGGTGTCTAVPVGFSFHNWSSSGTFNICPAIEPIAGGIMLLSAGLGAYTSIDNILDA